jgi:dTDP-4-amino-4,6-dideoxygalactose transaminase
MAANKIQVSRVHERNDKHSCVSKYLSYLPSLEKVIDKMICLPVGWHVTEEQVDFVISKIKQGWQ